MRSILPPACLLLLVLAGCGKGQGQGEAAGAGVVLPRDMVGCYALYDGEGRLASDSLYFAPSRVRLDSVAVTGHLREWAGDSAWSLTRLDTAGRPMEDGARDRMFLHWAADSLSDSVRISFNTGLSGAELIVMPRAAPADTLRGRAVEHWDMGPPFITPAGPVTVIRIPCAAGTEAKG